LTAALTISSGCIDTDPAVFVDPDLENPSLTVSEKALGVELGGSFEITLHLGARASGDSTVAFDAFSLETEDGTVVLESLPVSTNTNLPVTVPAGGDDVVVAFDISTGDTLLESDMKDALCGQALVLSVILDASLATQATPVASDPFEALCP
jgi:hypothetical protein